MLVRFRDRGVPLAVTRIGERARQVARELDTVDRAVYQTIGAVRTPLLDVSMARLSNAANYSRLWLGCAAVMAAIGGRRGRRAAFLGVASIGLSSVIATSSSNRCWRAARPNGTRPSFRVTVGCGCRRRRHCPPATALRRSRSPPRSGTSSRPCPYPCEWWPPRSRTRGSTPVCTTRPTPMAGSVIGASAAQIVSHIVGEPRAPRERASTLDGRGQPATRSASFPASFKVTAMSDRRPRPG